MSILKRQVNSSSKFVLFFIVVKHIIIHFKIWIKRSHQSPNFETLKCSGKNLVNSSCDFPNHKSVIFKFFIPLQCHEKWLFGTFLAQKLYTLFRRSPLKCKLFKFLSACVTIRQISYVNFENASQFLFKVCIILYYHDI